MNRSSKPMTLIMSSDRSKMRSTSRCARRRAVVARPIGTAIPATANGQASASQGSIDCRPEDGSRSTSMRHWRPSISKLALAWTESSCPSIRWPSWLIATRRGSPPSVVLNHPRGTNATR